MAKKEQLDAEKQAHLDQMDEDFRVGVEKARKGEHSEMDKLHELENLEDPFRGDKHLHGTKTYIRGMTTDDSAVVGAVLPGTFTSIRTNRMSRR